jgi:hypothetical protein
MHLGIPVWIIRKDEFSNLLTIAAETNKAVIILSAQANASTIVVDVASNVGIGTASPATKLHVLGDATIEGNDLRIDNNADNNTTVTIDSGSSAPQESNFVFASMGFDKWLIKKDASDELFIKNVDDSTPIITFKSGNVTDLDTTFTKADVDAMDIHAHASRHEAGGEDPISGLGGSSSLLQGTFVFTNSQTVTFSPTVGGNIVVNIDGAVLTRTTSLDFILDDFGVGGSHLDVGSEASSTPYYLYVDNVAGVMTPVISATPPDDIGDTKPGYHPTRTDERCIGSIWNNSVQNITPFIMNGNKVQFTSRDQNDHLYSNSSGFLGANSSGAWRNLNLDLPLTCISVEFNATSNMPAANCVFVLGAGNASSSPLVKELQESGNQDVLYAGRVRGSDDGSGFSITGSIPIVNRLIPNIRYAMVDSSISNSGSSDNPYWHTIGYTDLWAPK